MNKLSKAKEVIEKNNGIVKTAELNKAGLTNFDIVTFCNKKILERVKHGYYKLPENTVSEEYILSKLLPEAVVCIESALFHYGYSDFTPRQWTIAVKRNISRSKLKIDYVPLKAYFIQEDLLDMGITQSNFNGVKLPVYDRERTICDCFKYQSKMDSELFVKAVKAYANDDKKNLSNLTIYAKRLRVYKKLKVLMEVLLND